MRIKPSAAISVVLFAIYIAIIVAFWKANDMKYDQVSDTVATVKEGVVYPVGTGALFLIVAATVLGWWKPAIREDQRFTNKAVKFIPLVLVLGAASNLVATKWDNVTGEFALWLVIGVALVGFSEEMLTRGLGLVGARGSFTEHKAMWFTAILFGVLHVPNAFFGQSVAVTLQQIVFATVFGLVYYTVRRGTGTLVVPMVLHAMWDGSLFVNDHSGGDPAAVANLFMLAAVVVTFITLRHESKANKAQLATA